MKRPSNHNHPFSLFVGGYYQRGRINGLPSLPAGLGRNATAACRCFDHPRLDCGLLHQDTLFIPECPNSIPRYLKRLMPIMGHVAGLEGCLMDEVSVFLRPIFEKIDGIGQGAYLPDQASPFLQIDGTIKGLRVHRYLTENVGDQQGWRRIPAPAENVFSRFFRFNTRRMKFFREVHA